MVLKEFALYEMGALEDKYAKKSWPIMGYQIEHYEVCNAKFSTFNFFILQKRLMLHEMLLCFKICHIFGIWCLILIILY